MHFSIINFWTHWKSVHPKDIEIIDLGITVWDKGISIWITILNIQLEILFGKQNN